MTARMTSSRSSSSPSWQGSVRPRPRDAERTATGADHTRGRLSIAKPERCLRELIVVANLLSIEFLVKFVEAADVEHALPGNANPVMALDYFDGRVTFLLQRLDHSIGHEVVRLDLPFHFFLRHPPLVRVDDVQFRFEAILVQVDSHVRDQPVQDEAAVDDQVLVRPGRHGLSRRCGLRYLMRSSSRSRPKRMKSPVSAPTEARRRALCRF